MDTNVVLPHPSGDAYVELSDSKKGKVFRKQILRMNQSFVHPADHSKRIKIDSAFAQKLVDNFKAGVCDIVQFPLVNDKNQHVENPDANLGQVVDLSYDDTGVYADIDVRKNPESIGTTVLGASAMMSLDYTDTITGARKGPTLLHVAATNRPYLTNLAPYEAVALSNYDEEYVMLSPDNTDSDSSETESENPMSLEELLAKLKEDFDIDVAALQAAAKVDEESADETPESKTDEAKAEEAPADEASVEPKAEESADEAPVEPKAEEEPAALSAVSPEDAHNLFAALSAVLTSADPGLVALSKSEDDITIEDIASGIVELSNGYKAMAADVEAMKHEKAVGEVEKAVEAGRITPAQKDAMLELRLSNEELFNKIVPSEPLVSLSAQTGVTSHEPVNAGQSVQDEKENLIKKMTELANKS